VTAKELLKRLLDLPVPIDEATVAFQDGKLAVTFISSGKNSGVYLIE